MNIQNKISSPLIFGILLTSVVFVSILGFESDSKSNEVIPQEKNSITATTDFRLPDSVSFAGEKMPLDNFDTRESLNAS